MATKLLGSSLRELWLDVQEACEPPHFKSGLPLESIRQG